MMRGSLFNRPFGSIFRELEDEFANVERQVDDMLRQSTNTPSGNSRPLVWGYTLNVGPDGVPRFQPFGNTGMSQQEQEAGWREPFCTSVVDEENNRIRVTAELPGVDRDQIKVEALTDSVQIQATGDDRRYRTEVPVGVELDTDSAEAHYNNGILEVTVQLAEPIRKRGKQIKVK